MDKAKGVGRVSGKNQIGVFPGDAFFVDDAGRMDFCPGRDEGDTIPPLPLPNSFIYLSR